MAGISEFSVRLPSVLLGVAAIGGIFVVGRRLFDVATGLMAALFLAVAPFHIAYSQETRPYALMVVVGLLVLFFFIRLQERWTRLSAVAFLLSAAALLYTHTYGPFTLVALNVYYFLDWALRRKTTDTRPRNPAGWILLQVLLVAAYAPWLWKLSSGLEGIREYTTFIPLPTPMRVARYFSTYAGGPFALAASILTILGALALNFPRRDRFRSSGSRLWREMPGAGPLLLLTAWLLVPILVAVAISYLVGPMFVPRYTIACSLAFYLVLAWAVRNIRPATAVPVVLLILVGLSALGTHKLFHTVRKELWREATAYVERRAQPGDAVLVLPSWGRRCLNYYSGRNDLTKAGCVDLKADLAKFAPEGAKGKRLWLVLWYRGLLESVERDLHGPEYRIIDVAEFRAIRVVQIGN